MLLVGFGPGNDFLGLDSAPNRRRKRPHDQPFSRAVASSVGDKVTICYLSAFPNLSILTTAYVSGTLAMCQVASQGQVIVLLRYKSAITEIIFSEQQSLILEIGRIALHKIG
jgi:hypothetical protein